MLAADCDPGTSCRGAERAPCLQGRRPQTSQGMARQAAAHQGQDRSEGAMEEGGANECEGGVMEKGRVKCV